MEQTTDALNDGLESVAGVVLAGTFHWKGTRFDTLRARPLLPVAQRALIDHVLHWFASSGVSKAIICANGSTTALNRYLDAGALVGTSLDYHHNHSPRGAAGCVKDAAAKSDAQTFVITDGTSIPTADLGALIEHHRRTRAAVTIVAHPARGPFTDEPHLSPTGTYVFEREVLDAVPATSFQDIKESLIPKLHAAGRRMELFLVDEVSPRVLDPGTYLAVNQWAIERMVAARGDGDQCADVRSPQLIADPTAWVEKGAMIVGPVVLGPGVRVHASAVIVGPSSIGPGTTIREGAVVTRTVTWANCMIGEHAMVDQCILADDAVIPSNTTVSGILRLRERPSVLGRSKRGSSRVAPRGARSLPRPSAF